MDEYEQMSRRHCSEMEGKGDLRFKQRLPLYDQLDEVAADPLQSRAECVSLFAGVYTLWALAPH